MRPRATDIAGHPNPGRRVPVAFNLLFLLGPPSFSSDVLSYISHGYIATEMAGNPYLQPEAAVVGTTVEPQLVARGWGPGHPVSPYGPLWTGIEAGVVGFTEDVPTQIFAFKALAMAAALSTAALIWVALGRARAETRLLGTLAFLWNPMVVVELAGEGHNDG